jgi:hypothetical protein
MGCRQEVSAERDQGVCFLLQPNLELGPTWVGDDDRGLRFRRERRCSCVIAYPVASAVTTIEV